MDSHDHPNDRGSGAAAEPDVFPSSRLGRGRLADLTPVVAAVSAGGAVGAAGRYAATVAWPPAEGSLPVTTLAVNVCGCALIGILMVAVVELWPHRRLVRPFMGTGVLGGFTTFSTYAVDVQQLASVGQVGTAAAYLLLTPILAVLAATLTARATRRLISWRSA